MKESQFEKLIEIIENEYNWCFSFLMSFKHINPDFVKDLFEFQPKLASILLRIMDAYHDICAEEKQLIKQKAKYIKKDFSKNMALLAEQKKQLKAVIDIGKSLGDGFAWFFYRDSNRNLHKHLSHKENPLFVSGIGASGEIAFIKENQIINGCFVVYHSITSMLRIGDFSLCTVDGNVLGVGEIKTRKDGNHLQISVYLSSKIEITSESIPNTTNDTEFVNPDPNRLIRELNTQDELLKIVNSKKNMDFFNAEYQFDTLENAYHSQNHMAISDDKSLAVILFKYGNSLKNYLFATESVPDNFFDDAKEISQIADNQSNFSAIHFAKCDVRICGFRRPVIWWPVSDEIVYGLIMHTIEVFNCVNYAFFYEELIKLGYTVEPVPSSEAKPRYSITKKNNNSHISIESIDMIRDLILHDYMKCSYAADTMDTMVQKSIFGLKNNSKIEFTINQRGI